MSLPALTKNARFQQILRRTEDRINRMVTAESKSRSFGQSFKPESSVNRLAALAVRNFLTALYPAYRVFQSTFARRYRRSSLGLFWGVAPLALTLISVQIGQRAQISALMQKGFQAQSFAVIGVLLAQTFLETFNTQRVIFSAHRAEHQRHPNAVEVYILAGVAENLFSLTIRMVLLTLLMTLSGAPLSFSSSVGLIGVFTVFTLGSGLGLLASGISAIKQDIEHFLNMAPFLLFAVTPILVKPSFGSQLANFYSKNPLTYLFDSTRSLLLSQGTMPDVFVLVGSLVFASLLFTIGAVLSLVSRPVIVERLQH